MSNFLSVFGDDSAASSDSLRTLPDLAFLGVPETFKTASGSRAVSGDTLTTWQDQSFAGRNLTIGNDSTAPVVNNYTNNGKSFSALTFTGTEILVNRIQPINYFNHNLFIVASVSGNDRDLVGTGGVTEGNALLQRLPRAHFWSSGGALYLIDGTSSKTPEWRVYEQWYDGATLQILVNGTVENQIAAPTGAVPSQGLFVGCRYDQFQEPQRLVGAVAAVCVLSRAATGQERQQIRRTLGALAGINV